MRRNNAINECTPARKRKIQTKVHAAMQTKNANETRTSKRTHKRTRNMQIMMRTKNANKDAHTNANINANNECKQIMRINMQTKNA